MKPRRREKRKQRKMQENRSKFLSASRAVVFGASERQNTSNTNELCYTGKMQCYMQARRMSLRETEHFTAVFAMRTFQVQSPCSITERQMNTKKMYKKSDVHRIAMFAENSSLVLLN
mmetsp:Transcript_4268/g.6285  ORF Transcript_4268/g.6285 Transcript_4268/m.6285 type:complete len:117 (+) Transcript_4268:228-578(+)